MTIDNWEAVVEIELCRPGRLDGGQIYSVAETQFDPDTRPRCVYADKHVVGFLMYDVQKKKDKAQKASIYNFMIDWKHQDKGYGRAALSKALQEIRAIPGVNRISIRYMPENPIAKPFYIIFSLVEVGRDRDGDVIAVLKL